MALDVGLGDSRTVIASPSAGGRGSLKGESMAPTHCGIVGANLVFAWGLGWGEYKIRPCRIFLTNR